MNQRITEVMSTNPMALQKRATLTEAARAMRDHDVGDVLVMDGKTICGVMTDRDIVVRAVAEGRSPDECTLGELCTHDLVTLSTTDTVDDAIAVMREHAVRRLPVLHDDELVGVVSLGDLALERDPGSVLGTVSGAAPNN